MSLLALALTESLYSSNLEMVFCVLWTLRMRSILHMGASFFSQLDWNMISTMFLLVSSGPSSETVRFCDPEKYIAENWKSVMLYVKWGYVGVEMRAR